MKSASNAAAKPRGSPPGRKRQQQQSSVAERAVALVLQVLLVSVQGSVSTVTSSVITALKKWLALQLWAGRACGSVLAWLKTALFHAVAWLLVDPPFSKGSLVARVGRSYGLTGIKRAHIALGAVAAAAAASSLLRRWRERFDTNARTARVLRGRMAGAASYHEWRDLARQLDRLEPGRLGAPGSTVRESKLFDKKLLQRKLAHLRHVRDGGNVREMMFSLRPDLFRNVANIAKSKVYDYTYTVPPTVKEWTREVQSQLSMIVEWPEAGVSTEEKLAFFREARHAYGRTALLLSGGGSLGSFHIGVVKALFEHRMLPRVLAGSSVGSIVASIIATRTDDELTGMIGELERLDMSFFNNSRPVELVHHFLRQGVLQDTGFFKRKLQQLMGSYTFLEAYERTGRILNVSVCPADTNEPPRLLNYLTAPHALVWSAVAASSAFPGLFAPQDILARNARGDEVPFNSIAAGGTTTAGAGSGTSAAAAERRWRDGSLELDLPTFLLAEMFNCNHFIVSQCNPHIAPLLNFKKTLSPKWGNLLELELRHRCLQAQWLLSDVIPTKWLTLFTQPWEGDVTIVLPSALWNISKSITNPTSQDLLTATRWAERLVWEKLSAIEANCAIEATLDACLARLTNKARERPLGGLPARIPSWLSMPGFGQAAVASWGNPLQASKSALWGPGGWRVASASASLDRFGSSAGSAAGGLAAAVAAGVPHLHGGGYGAASGGAHIPPTGGIPPVAAPASGGGNTAAEAMAAAAAAAMAGQPRVSFYHPPPLGAGAGPELLAAAASGVYAGAGFPLASGPVGAMIPTIHEAMSDERPRRIVSWGSSAFIADSASDYPNSGSGSGSGSEVSPRGSIDGTAAGAGARTAAGGALTEDVAAGLASGGASFSLPAAPTISGDTTACSTAGSSAAGGGGGEKHGAHHSTHQGAHHHGAHHHSTHGTHHGPPVSGPSFRFAPQLECCDPTAVLDLWGGLFALGTATVALEAAAADGEGLDVIAP